MSAPSRQLTDTERDVRRSLVEGAEKSEADRDRLLATSWIGAIASMYAFANGVSGGGPWPPRDEHNAGLGVGAHGAFSLDRYDLPRCERTSAPPRPNPIGCGSSS